MIFATIRILIIFKFRLLGRLFGLFSSKRKNIALKNINYCFKSIDKKGFRQNKKIMQKCFANLGHSFADFLLLRFYKKDLLDKYFKIKNFERFKKALALGRGVILSTGHFGSWELAAHYLALHGYKSFILYNPVKNNKWLEAFIKKNREFSGNVLIPKKDSLLTLYKHLKKGGIVIMATDQHCYLNDGIEVELFGQKVRTHTAFIKLSLKTGTPIVPGFVYIKDLFNYELEILPPIYPEDYDGNLNAVLDIARRSNLYLESAIKNAPENWLWSHRRFKGIIKY